MKRIPPSLLCGWLVWLVAGLCVAAWYRTPAGSLADFGSLYSAGYLAVHHPSELYSLAAQQAVQHAAEPRIDGVLPFVHLGYEALLYTPFTLLSYHAGYAACMVVNLLLLLASFVAARGLFSRVIPIWQPRPGLAIFLFFPAFCAIIQGQDSLLLLLICCVALGQLNSRQDATAGAVLALALFKFQIALPILLLLAARKGRRGWRIVAGFAPVAGLLVAGSLAMTGVRSAAALRALLLACLMPDKAANPVQANMYVDPSKMPNLMGVVFTTLGGSLSERACFGVVALLSAAALVWGVVRMRRTTSEVGDEAEVFAIAILCTVLVSYHLYLHDATLLLIPLALWAGRIAGAILLMAPLVLFFWAPHQLCFLALPVVWLLVDARGSRPASKGPGLRPESIPLRV